MFLNFHVWIFGQKSSWGHVVLIYQKLCMDVYFGHLNIWTSYEAGASLSRIKTAPSHMLRPRQNGLRFADDTFKRIFLNENVRVSVKISLKFVPKGPINNIPAWVQIMAWRRSGDKPLSEPMVVSLLKHICVTRPQWVNTHSRVWYFVCVMLCDHEYQPIKLSVELWILDMVMAGYFV